jgi:hypothetical protein
MYRNYTINMTDTTIRVSKETRHELGEIGTKNETLEQIIQRLVKEHKEVKQDG